MKNEGISIEELIAGGLIGASLGALISKDKEEESTIGAIAGAALFATLKANKKAKESDLPLVYEENGIVYSEFNGKRTILKTIEKPIINFQRKYKLK